MPNIQKMTLQDYEQVKRLWIESGLSDEPEDQIEEIGEFLVSTQCAAFVAKKNENIIGAVLCGNDGRYGYIHHLAVALHSRNNGVGRLLVQVCMGFLKKRHILIMVKESNDIGNAFWRQMEFQQVNSLKIKCINTVN